MAVNALRAFLAEFGLIAAKRIERVPHLLAIGRESKMLPATAKARIEIDAEVLCTLAKAIDGLEQEISRHHACNPVSQLLDGVPGIGTLIASAVVAYVPNPEHFRSGRDFSAWLGLTPREHSSGGKSKLGRISKQGNPYLRKLLVLAATSLLRVQPQRRGPLAEWVRELLARKPARLVTVALANRLARILWAMMKSGEEFRMIIFARGVAAA